MNIAILKLTKGQVAVIDAADLPLVVGFSWRALEKRAGRWYAASVNEALNKV